jgi:hypothetical protein
MKKKVALFILTVVCVLSICMVASAEKHFDYNEAYQIAKGNWCDSNSGQSYSFIWASGEECNIVGGGQYGYTDLNGDSKIYFDMKGIAAYMQVTYYKDQKTYYARVYTRDMRTGQGAYRVYKECLYKTAR